MDATFYAHLDQYLVRGQIREAEEFLLQNWEEAQAEEKNHADRTTVLNELMGFYRDQGDFPQCEHYMKALLREIRALNLRDGLPFATLMLNIANACRAMGKLAEAERTFLQVKDIYLEELRPDDFRLAGLYNNLGLVYRAKGETRQAYENLTRALEIIEQIPGAGVPLAATLSNLADVLLELDQTGEAEECARRAVVVLESQPQRPAGDYAAALCAVGRVCFVKTDYAGAAEAYGRALEVMKPLGNTQTLPIIQRNLDEAKRNLGKEEV
jgi:tetratricopeptide (TPR) repeat protein